MSLESWKLEFYPIAAEDVPKAQALEHSLRKWEGLRRKNLERHEVATHGRELVDSYDGSLEIDSASCALCCHYDDVQGYKRRCEECPLALSRGGVPCDDATAEERENAQLARDGKRFGYKGSPYSAWTVAENPEPMIAALTKAREFAG